jgi:hypothetical protein
MDKRLVDDRGARGKQGPSKCKFTDLKIVKAVDPTDYPGIAVLIGRLLGDEKFQGNLAAYLSVSPPIKDATGHAVAILRDNKGQYTLFDPNFGTYSILSAEKIREAISYIFKQAYPNMPSGGSSDNRAYEIGNKVKGSYTIFEGELKRLPKAAPILSPVVEAPTTAVQSAAVPQPQVQPAVKQAVVTQKPVVPPSPAPKPFSQPSPAPTTPSQPSGSFVSVSDRRKMWEKKV